MFAKLAAASRSVLQVVLPKKKNSPTGLASTNTFSPSSADNPLPLPGYRDHLTDVFDSRVANDSRTLMQTLFKHDSDVSAAVNAYLTVANTEPRLLVFDADGKPDRNGQKLLHQILLSITQQVDYSLGFKIFHSLKGHAEQMRYMLLLRGALACELVFDKQQRPVEIRHIDPNTIKFIEKSPGQYKPQQEISGQTDPINLDFPTFFMGWFRKDPTTIYNTSHFVAAINTIAARQQVINDLYRIMRVTGFPRIDVKVLEEVVTNSAPPAVKADAEQMRAWLRARLQEVATLWSNIRADQAFVHFDSVEASTMNEKNPGVGIDIKSVIDTLNGQNQAALKSMGTIIGRGESGVNTASVEARIFAMNADELNEPIAKVFSDMFTLALRLQGFAGYVQCVYPKAELRPVLELEAHMTQKQTRLLQMLSLGIIDDETYHIEMFGRMRPDSAPELSGTGFMDAKSVGGASDPSKGPSDQPNPLERSTKPAGGDSSQSNASK